MDLGLSTHLHSLVAPPKRGPADLLQEIRIWCFLSVQSIGNPEDTKKRKGRPEATQSDFV